MAPTPLTTIIVFHSYPQKPCIDGLMAAIIATWIYQSRSSKVRLVPYSRTKKSFDRLKQTVEETDVMGDFGRQQIVYVDCTPDLEEEIEFLEKIVDKIPITVYDHHQMRDDAPVRRLNDYSNFELNFNADKCAAKMMYNLMLESGVEAKYDIENLLTVVQFSEYEGMDFTVAGKVEAEKITNAAFKKAMNPSNEELIKDVEKIDMSLFYVLDQVLTNEKDWAFFADSSLTSDEVFNKFEIQSKLYLERTNLILSGRDMDVYSADKLTAYLDLMHKLPGVLASGKVIENVKIADKIVSVYAANINIFHYGRSLEPMVVKELQTRGASYAILMNDPTRNAKTGALSYYFSLRRVDGAFSARDLAFYLLDITGSKIGGGHPWASGVTLNKDQYQKYLNDFLNQQDCQIIISQ
ncbi:uncharacterized protein [Clytia hemisphaerica]|uniref:Uncharacterized protein n=1 Tax=Clytia hemisphaerica TaxID=252671 RepID=A0A7M5UID3_9CNID